MIHEGVKLSTKDSVVLAVRELTEDTFVLTLSSTGEYVRAGQCFSIGTHDLGINREYSIYSGSHENQLEFLIRKIDGGAVSARLGQLAPGDLVQIGGPYGSFCLDEVNVAERKYVFVCSGTGIAPFSSFVKSFPELDYQIFHGVRFENEAYECEQYDQKRYFSCVSRPKNGGTPGRVTDLLREEELPDDALYYLCGNRNMITDSVNVLRTRGVPGGSIFMETFF